MKSLPTDADSNSKTKMCSLRKSESDVEVELGLHPARRPVNIEKDVSSLGQSKRVSSILRSPDFKEELETVVTDLLRSDKAGNHVFANAIANVISPFGQAGYAGNALHPMKTGIGCVSPINDLTGADTSMCSKGEKLLRCKLAALYRIVDLFGWSSTIYNHITVRVNQEQEHFLIHPFGLLYHEVSASKLLKVNMQGEVVDSGSTTLGFNLSGYTLHSAIHAARPDVHCVIHVHTTDAIAISCMEGGLLPISQEALIVGDVSYHNYHGILVDQKEKKAIQKHLGPTNKVMILQNHGLVACGETVEEAFHYLYFTMMACSIQMKAMSCVKPDKLIHLNRSLLKSRTEEVGRKDVTAGVESSIKWGPGEMMFEALVRMLDDMGYRSGYVYRNPILMKQKPKPKSGVEVPATAVGHTAVLPEDLEDAHDSLKPTTKAHWVNSPNQYTRVVQAVDEEPVSGASSQNGDASPRVKAKWKKSEDPGAPQTTSVRIAGPNQFVPTNTDPREVLALRRSIRGQGKNRAGPQSQLLYNVSPDRSQSSNQVVSSSKAIIQKGQEVEIVSPMGPPNPFNEMSSNGLKKYEKEVCGESHVKKDHSQGDAEVTEEKCAQVESTTKLNASEPALAAILKVEDAHHADKNTKGATAEAKNVTTQKPKLDSDETQNIVIPEKSANFNSSNNARSSDDAHQSPDEEEVRRRETDSPGGKKSEKKKRRPLSFLKKKKN
ncbi:alpha-adducin-like isoform X1 [Clavelina lepadiformis]|uniref:alpha-adducin-like isoform X1 n=1 Tax=Clavelina lepadiformis TaxID=159417 RepID=UPI0040424C5F